MILFSCLDVGPAKYIAQIAKHFPYSYLYCSDLNRFVFKELNLQHIINFDQIKNLKNINLIITGTSTVRKGIQDEKDLINFAKSKNIKSISFIEHWYWYLNRFKKNNKLIFPDYFIVNDLIAKKQAINEGLPAKKIFALGNPYLEFLSKKRKRILDKNKLKVKYNIPENKKIICFISEEIKSKNLFGYDEYSILKFIIDNFLNEKTFIIIKKHPEEKINKFQKFLSSNVIIINKCQAEEIATFSDHIIGMHSMLLIELCIFRNDIISTRPNNKKEFIGEILEIVVDIDKLSKLENALEKKSKAKNKITNIFEGSEKRIIDFINIQLNKK